MKFKNHRDYWQALSELGCIVTMTNVDVTMHHCHGGSMLMVPGLNNPGIAQKQNDWLVIPLTAKLHTGEYGIDNGMGRYKSVKEWEMAFGKQVDFIDDICYELDFDVWKAAGLNLRR